MVEGIIAVESGGNPWALHVGIGKGYAFYPRSAAQARRLLAVSLALTDNVDIGLMQINWRTWRESVRALGLDAYDLLDARTNMEMGCRVLAQALSGRGSFLARLGRYHSRRPERGRWYARRVMAAARELDRKAVSERPKASNCGFGEAKLEGCFLEGSPEQPGPDPKRSGDRGGRLRAQRELRLEAVCGGKSRRGAIEGAFSESPCCVACCPEAGTGKAEEEKEQARLRRMGGIVLAMVKDGAYLARRVHGGHGQFSERSG